MTLADYRSKIPSERLVKKVEEYFVVHPAKAFDLLSDIGLTSSESNYYYLLLLLEGFSKKEKTKPVHRVLDYVYADPYAWELALCEKFLTEFKPQTDYEKLVHKFVKDYLELIL